MIETSEFQKRREKLYEKIDDNSILILYAGVSKKKSADENYDFEVNKNFYYLTNIEEEGSMLLVSKQDGVYQEYLFIPQNDPNIEKWTGRRTSPQEATKKSGIDNVLFLNAFDSQLDLFIKKRKSAIERINKIYLDLEPENILDGFKTTKEVEEALHLNYPWLNFADIYREIILLRMVKSSQEIKEIEEAINTTDIGLKQIMSHLRPNKMEYQMSALFYYTIQDYDYSDLSFPTIAASGMNATTLHYPSPKSKINNGDLVLFDLGAKHNGYCADISRTYPSNGKFSEKQKEIYNIVLTCNKEIIKHIKPGVTLKELNDIATDILAKGLVKAGIMENESQIKSYYFHSIGHHLGLDTHDPSDRNLPLVAGNVITDEPGLYIKELGIGIRIEDDILVTDDGSYCLSGKIIKEVADIERAMRSIND